MSNLTDALIAAKLVGGSGGSGGGSGLEHVWANLTYEEPEEEGDDPVHIYTLNKTYAELKAFADAGKLIYFDGYYSLEGEERVLDNGVRGFVTVGGNNEYSGEYYVWVTYFGGYGNSGRPTEAVGFRRILFIASSDSSPLVSEERLIASFYTLEAFQLYSDRGPCVACAMPISTDTLQIELCTVGGSADVEATITVDPETGSASIEFGDFSFNPERDKIDPFDESALCILLAQKLIAGVTYYDSQHTMKTGCLGTHVLRDEVDVVFTL